MIIHGQGGCASSVVDVLLLVGNHSQCSLHKMIVLQFVIFFSGGKREFVRKVPGFTGSSLFIVVAQACILQSCIAQ